MENRNLLLALILSVAVLIGWSMLFPTAEQPVVEAEKTPAATTPQKTSPTGLAPQEALLPEAESDRVPKAPREESQQTQTQPAPDQSTGKIYTLANDVLSLEINDKGWIISGVLKKYRESIAPDSANISFVNISDGHSIYINTGILGSTLAQPFTLARKDGNTLVLEGKLANGSHWERTLTLKPGSYLLDVTDRVKHAAGIRLYMQAIERNPERKKSTFYEHVGPVALIGDKLEEIKYDDLDEKGAIRKSGHGGWIGIMNRYFIAAIIGVQQKDYPYFFKTDGLAYQAGLIDDGTLQGKDAIFHTTVFIGPKSLPVLKQLNVGLERSVDYGWYAFIAKPMHSFLVWMHQFIPNYGWCIILLVVLIKILFFWPTQKSYESMAAMRKLQPEMARLKDLYGDDRQRMSQEMMKLYKKHQVNPLGGCLPMVIQIPVFFALYKVLLISIELRQAPFIGWIHDMSVQDPYFVLPVLMGISMFVQQRLNPQPAEPVQAKVMQFLPIIFTAMFLFFPAGLVLYWLVNNILSIIQQWYVMKVKKAI